MPNLVTALLAYHVLNGAYSASSFTSMPQFIPSLLANTSYINFTGGQRVEGYTDGSSVDIVSGGLATSMVVTAVSLPNSIPLLKY
jgi:transforming growth factor-beta-induced protein